MSMMSLHRVARRFHRHGWLRVARLVDRAIYLLYHSWIPAQLELDDNTTLAFGGIIIHPQAKIGANVTIGQQVTIGGRSRYAEVPVIEDDCFIGPGARILGPVRIGAGSIIGANAVVVHDVPPRSIALGVPARVVRSGIRTEDYYTKPGDALIFRQRDPEKPRQAASG